MTAIQLSDPAFLYHMDSTFFRCDSHSATNWNRLCKMAGHSDWCVTPGSWICRDMQSIKALVREASACRGAAFAAIGA